MPDPIQSTDGAPANTAPTSIPSGSPPLSSRPRTFARRDLLLMLPLFVTLAVVLGTYHFYNRQLLPYARGTDLSIPPALEAAQIQAQTSLKPADKALAKMTTTIEQYTARLIWTGFVGVFLTLWLAALATAAYVLFQVFKGEREGLALSPPTVLAMAIIIFGTALYIARAIDYGPIAHPALGPTVSKNFPELHLEEGQRQLDQVDQITALFLAATVALILPSLGCRDGTVLRVRTELLGMVLTVGTVLLVADVIREDALLRWGLTFAPDAGTKTALTRLVTTITAKRGLLGSVLLASIYLPGAFILRAQIRAVIPEDGQTSLSRVQGLMAEGPIAQLRPVITLLLPLLTGILSGPAANLLKNLPHP